MKILSVISLFLLLCNLVDSLPVDRKINNKVIQNSSTSSINLEDSSVNLHKSENSLPKTQKNQISSSSSLPNSPSSPNSSSSPNSLNSSNSPSTSKTIESENSPRMHENPRKKSHKVEKRIMNEDYYDYTDGNYGCYVYDYYDDHHFEEGFFEVLITN